MAHFLSKSMRTKRYLPLSWAMIILVFFAWFLPLLAISGFSLAIGLVNVYEQVVRVIEATVENSAHSMHLNLDYIVSDSINASYKPAVRNAYNKYLRDANSAEFYSGIVGFLQWEYSRNELVSSVHLVFPEQDTDARYFTYTPGVSDRAEAMEFYSNGAQERAVELMYKLGSDIDFIFEGGRLYLVRVFSLRNNSFSPYAVMASDINTELLFEGILDNEAILAATLEINDLRLPLLQNMALARIDGGVTITGTIDAERYRLGYQVEADMRPMLESLRQNMMVLIFLLLLCVPLVFAIFLFFYSKVTKPIKTLSAFAKSIEAGHFGAQVDVDRLGSREFGFLGGSLNVMSARLEEQFERLYREELALRDARMEALQSQINPHFLRNTLEIIGWEARLADDAKVCRMLEALATMLDAVLDRKLRPMARLSEEMTYIRAYLYIISERLGKRLSVELSIPDELLEWHVPRLILQPLVENAFEHGIDRRHKGSLFIRAEKETEDWMRIEVINDSAMSEDDERRVAALLSSMADSGEPASAAKLGIRNVNQRLLLLYGEKARLCVKNDEKRRTVSSFYVRNE